MIGIPYDFDAKENKPENVSAVAQIVTLDDWQEVKQDLQIPAPVTVPNGEFDNADFSEADWRVSAGSTGVTQKVETKNNHSGANRFRIWLDKDYQFDVSQTLAELKAGTHMISFAVNAGDFGENDEFYAYAKDGHGNILTQEPIRATAEGAWEIAGMTLEVSDSPVAVGFSGKFTAGAWANIDEFRMGRLEEAEAFTKARLKALLEEADGLKAADADIQNDIFWRDTEGKFIYSQGGGIFKFGDTYYWYGVKYEEAEKYAQDPTTGPYKTDPSPKFLGVTCYSSKNLVDWKNEGVVVDRAEVTARPEMNNQEAAWVGRLGVAKVGEKYALLVQHECPDEDNSLDGNMDTDKWTVHENNNYVKNGSFDADRVAATQLAGWTNTVSKGNSPINNNEDEVTGKYALRLGDSVDFDCKVSQTITQDTATADAVVLPDGTYSLTAKVKNSGAFDELSMYAKSGSLTKKAIITQAHTAYTEVTLRDVTVSGGKAEIGFIAKGSAKASVLVDDVALVRSREQSADTESIAVPVSSDVAKDVAITVAAEDGTVAYIYEGQLEIGKHSYAITPVKAGTYTVTVAVNACEIQGAAQKVTVTAGQPAQVPEVMVFNQGGNIEGKVVDGNGTGIAGVTVTLMKGEQSIQIKTKDDGTFGVSDILAGTYTIRLEKEGYVSPEQKTVAVEVGKTATLADQAMQSAMGTVTGKVRNIDGTPAGNATVTLRGCKTKSSDRRYTVQADAEGTYRVPVIEDTYQVLASKEGVNVQGVSLEKFVVERNKSYTADVMIPEAAAVPNGDFERELNAATDWSNNGTRGKWTNRAADVLSGKGGYNIWDGSADFTVDLSQTLKDLENGTYVVNVKADSGFQAEDELYVYAKDAAGTLLAREDIPNISIDKKGEVIGIVAEVKDGTLTIGLSGSMSGGAWSHVDDFCVGRIEHINTGVEEEKIDISKAKIAAIPTQVYTGKPLIPAVKVTYEDKILVNGQDYKLSYKNNKNIGTATVTVAGIGRYEKSLSGKFTITVKKNKIYIAGDYKYKITDPKANGKGTVAVIGGKNKSLKSVKVSHIVKIGGKKFKITSVGKNAFKGYKKLGSVTLGKNVAKIEAGAFEKCGKLKKIKIGGTALKSVGKNAIKGIGKKAVIQCPKKQLAKYMNLFKASTGYKKTMKVKK